MTRLVSEVELWKIFRTSYKDEPFIRFIRDKKGLLQVSRSKICSRIKFCDIGFDIDDDNKRIVALSASDNLMKGAAGSAIQNMNLMYQYNEKDGLNYTPLTPV